MSSPLTCPFCFGDLVEMDSSERIKLGRRKVFVKGLKKSVCSACGEELVTSAQGRANRELIDASIEREQKLVYPGLLRGLRERWDLTQAQTSRLFGAGSNAWAKWESGGSVSGPAALLILCALNVDGVMQYLGKKASLQLPERVDKPVKWTSDASIPPTLTVYEKGRSPRIVAPRQAALNSLMAKLEREPYEAEVLPQARTA